jgi:hypothetical protein
VTFSEPSATTANSIHGIGVNLMSTGGGDRDRSAFRNQGRLIVGHLVAVDERAIRDDGHGVLAGRNLEEAPLLDAAGQQAFFRLGAENGKPDVAGGRGTVGPLRHLEIQIAQRAGRDGSPHRVRSESSRGHASVSGQAFWRRAAEGIRVPSSW